MAEPGKETKKSSEIADAKNKVDTVVAKAEALKKNMSSSAGNEKGFRLRDIESMASQHIKEEKAKSPFDPKKPLDGSILEQAGIVGNKASSSNLSGKTTSSDGNSALASAHSALNHSEKNQEELVNNLKKTAANNPSISVNPDYKPNAQSKSAAQLNAKMSSPENNVLRMGGGGTPSSSSAMRGSNSMSQSQLGGGFRISEGPASGDQSSVPEANAGQNDPNFMATGNMGNDNQMPSGMSGNPGQPGQPGNPGGHDAANGNMSQSTHLQRYEESKSKRSGFWAGALGMLAGGAVAGGIALVALKPEVVSSVTNSFNLGTGVANRDAGLSQQQLEARRQARSAIIPSAEEVDRNVNNNVNGATVAGQSSGSRDTQGGINQQIAALPTAPRAAVTPPEISAGNVNEGFSPPRARRDNQMDDSDAVITVLDTKGEDNQPIPLSIAVRNIGPSEEAYVKISGIPDNTNLSDGIHLGPAGWLLPLSKLTTLRLTTPEGFSGTLILRAQLLKADAETPVGRSRSFKVLVQSADQLAASQTQRNAVSPVETASTNFASATSLANEPVVAPVARANVNRRLPGLEAPASEGADSLGGALPAGNSARPRLNRGTNLPRYVPARAPRSLGDRLPVDARRRAVTVDNVRTSARTAALTPRRAPQNQRPSNPAQPQISNVQKQRLIRRGDQLYRLGDLASARLMYQQVAVTGDPDAAMAMGRTFDPIYFDKLGVQGFDPEPETALEWYRKAQEGGLAKANEKIANLTDYMNR